MMETSDIAVLAKVAHEAGAILVVDNTFASPVLCRPFELGADVVIHSCTKYMNGHDDVMAGSVSVGKGYGLALHDLDQVRKMRTLYGPVLSPFEAWLLLRGMRTLDVRMQRHCKNALALAKVLQRTEQIIKVHYPGLEDSSTHCAANKTLSGGYGGMLSFELKGGRQAAEKLILELKMASFVPSLGSYATTISHPAATSHRGFSADERELLGITDGLIRVSVGIEEEHDIICDFMEALGKVGC
jgi:cystathionine beta-lyase/cystathionine gamma-synthase